MKHKSVAVGVLLLCTGIGIPFTVRGDEYPSKVIRYIVPFPPAGITDIMARNVAQKVSVSFKQSVVVDNRPGGNAMLGGALVAKSPPDGYTWFAMTITHAINASLFPDAPYNLLKDLTGVSILGSLPLVVVIHPVLPAKTLSQFTVLGRSRRLNGGSAGNGSPEHLTLELYRQLSGTNVQHIPFKGAGPAMVSLAGGEIEFVIEALPACLGYIKSNKVRPLAVTTPQRHALLPDIPTATEAGLPGLTLTSWTGLMVPSATPKDIVKRIYEEVAGALKQPDMVQKVREQGFEVVASAPEEAQAFITKEVERWGKVVREANVKPD